MDWKLTDEEIAEISRDIVKQAKATGGGEFGLAECFGLDNQLHRAIADAAARKVVEWANDRCQERMAGDRCFSGDVALSGVEWKFLKQEVGL